MPLIVLWHEHEEVGRSCGRVERTKLEFDTLDSPCGKNGRDLRRIGYVTL